MKKFLLICLTAMFAVASWAYEFSDGGFYYNIVSGEDLTCTVTSGDDAYTGDIVIPSTAQYGSTYYTVVGISEMAFQNCTGVTSLVVPNTVTSVGMIAFAGCTSLTTVTFQEGEEPLELATDGILGCTFDNCPVTTLYIGRQYSSSGGSSHPAFMTLSTLEKVTLGQYVTELEYCAFHDCSSLKELIIEDSDTALYLNTAIWDGNDFYYDDENGEKTEPFYQCPIATIYQGRDIEYSLTSESTSWHSPFSHSAVKNALTTVTFGEKVTKIGYQEFTGCSLITEVVLPESVTSIESNAFQGTSITEIVVSDNVTTLGSGAFYKCSSLVTAELGNGLTSLTSNLFYQCSALETVSLGENIASVGGSAFRECTALKSVTSLNHTPPTVSNTDTSSSSCPFYNVEVGNVTLYVPEGTVEDYEENAMWTQFDIQEIVEDKTQFEVDGVYYKVIDPEADEKEVEVTYGGESASSGTEAYAGDITIPASVNYNNTLYTVIGIGANAFRNCENLESVTIAEENVTYIEENAFRESSIKTVNLGAVETIKTLAFAESGLTSLTIPDNVTTIEPYAFQHCISMSELSLGKGLTYIDEYVFDSLGIKSLVIPDNIEEIGPYAFNRCMQMESIEMGSGLKTIDERAFYWSGLTSLTIPSTVATIGRYAFSDNLSLTTLDVDAETVGQYAFYGCDNLTSVNIGDNVKSLETGAFQFCPTLPSITIPGTTTIGTWVFAYCYSLKEVIIGEGITTCGSWTFRDCTSLTDVTLPETFTSLAFWMFQGCSSLKSITLPASVTYAAGDAFLDTALEEIYSLNPTPPSFSSDSGSGLDDFEGKCVLYIPVGSYEAYSTADGWHYLTIVEMVPQTLETLAATDITDSSATLSGSATAAYNEPILERGFEYWADEDVVQTIASDVTDDSEFSVIIDALAYGTNYTYRVYATTDSGTNYGEELTFTTDLYAPAIETLEATDVAETSAVLNGTVEQGSEPITRKGFVYWDGDPNQVTTIIISDEDVDMSYTLNSLTPETTYTYRAFAITDSGTTYGEDVEFTTLEDTTTSINGISLDSENVEGIYSTSGQKLNVTQKGVNIIRFSDGSVKKIYVK